MTPVLPTAADGGGGGDAVEAGACAPVAGCADGAAGVCAELPAPGVCEPPAASPPASASPAPGSPSNGAQTPAAPSSGAAPAAPAQEPEKVPPPPSAAVGKTGVIKDNEFIPTEEIQPDEAVTFPVDI